MNSEHVIIGAAEASIPKRSFAVVLTWPTIKNAEYEVIQRIFAAGRNIGAKVYVTDNDGYPLWSTEQIIPGKRIDRSDCDFLISLHFESPRLYDIYSYIALWNPPEFLSAFGYARSIEKMSSHNDVLSCNSPVADTHARNSFHGLGRAYIETPPSLYHSLPQPYLRPLIGEDSRLFYVGINWEKISGQKGRHHDLLKLLDDKDLIQIYGPKEFQGVEPWEDFKNYCGSIPFDGTSAVAEINKAGICLALSSRAHQRSGIMSTRLFEGLAAGAAIIANPHPLIEKYFSDCVYVIDDTADSAQLAHEICAIIIDIRQNPGEAVRRAEIGQRRLLEQNFGLEANLTALFETHPARMALAERTRLGSEPHSVSVILMFYGDEFDDFSTLFANTARQTMVNVELFVICDQHFYDMCRDQIDELCCSASIPAHVEVAALFYKPGDMSAFRINAAGELVARVLRLVKTPYFAVLQIDDHWMSDHLASLAGVLSRGDQQFACSGRLVEASGSDAPRRRLDSLTLDHFGDLLECSLERDAGRFLYKSTMIEILPLDTLSLLDGQEHQLFNLWALLKGIPAQSAFASYVYLENASFKLPIPYVPYSLQTEIIRDSVRGHPDWLQMHNTFPPQTSIKYRSIALDQLYFLKAGGDGIRFLSSGFSTPEADFVWVDGTVGTLLAELRADATDIFLQVSMAARYTPSSVNKRCFVFANGTPIGHADLTEELQSFYFATPDSLHRSSVVRISFKIETAEQVVDNNGKLLDARYLGLRIASFGLTTSQASTQPTSQLLKRPLLRRAVRSIVRRLT